MSDQGQPPEKNHSQNGEAQDNGPERATPSHIAYQVRENGDKSYFNNIGTAFEHKDGKGFNINLESVPVDGKVTLRTFEERLKKVQNGKGSASHDQEQER